MEVYLHCKSIHSDTAHFICTGIIDTKKDPYSWEPIGRINKTQYHKFNIFEAKQAIKSLKGEWYYWIEPVKE